MGRQDQIIKERIRKLSELRKAGINPYPNRYEVKHYSSDLQEKKTFPLAIFISEAEINFLISSALTSSIPA